MGAIIGMLREYAMGIGGAAYAKEAMSIMDSSGKIGTTTFVAVSSTFGASWSTAIKAVTGLKTLLAWLTTSIRLSLSSRGMLSLFNLRAEMIRFAATRCMGKLVASTPSKMFI